MKTRPPAEPVAERFPALAPLAATTVRLHPRRGEGSPSDSKLGGTVRWDPDRPWPRCPEHGTDLVAVLQLARADVPELPWPGDADLFLLCWCALDHPSAGYGPLCVTTWLRRVDLASGRRRAPPPGEGVPIPCRVHPERVVEYPHLADLPDGVRDAVSAWDELAEEDPPYQWSLSVASGTKAGGHVAWIQHPDWPACPTCGARMAHLVTIAACEFDGGTWRRWAADDAGEDPFARPYAERELVQAAHGVGLGDMGSVYVFCCACCPDRPSATVFQCS